jgi:protein involved in polysaccharide export with SLBB domain
MEEEAIPYTAAGYLYVKLAQVQSQRLRRAALELLALSKTSDQDLALEFGDLAMTKDDEDTESDDLDRLRLAVLREEMFPADSEGEGDDQEA